MSRIIIDKRYKVLRKLGTGAHGTVYKVRDGNNNKVIALKILSKKKISSETMQRFKREFKLLAGLQHPNLCAVYDFGILKDGRNYFTMEYIDGENIFQASKGLSYKKMYSWIVQLCRALQYIHSKGLIHYDIKPGNVLIQYVDNTPCVKLMDFGLAGEQRIRGGIIIRGTFPYIAPEIIKGLAVDHRADLYSLGVLLYKIFTKKSFKVKDETSFTRLLQQQQARFSKPLSRIARGIPKRLERLIVQLCSFEPATRFSRANEIIGEINKLSRLKFEFETEKTLESYLMSSKFVGREKEMELLTSLYEKARKGEGKVVLITGDAGIGKSRLLREFKIVTQLKHSHSFIGYAHRDKTGPLDPFYAIFSELINYLGKGLDLSRTKKLRLSLAVLFKIFPNLTDGHLRKNLPKLVPLEPQQEKLRNFEALSESIGYFASSLGELVILLENLHWADDLTIQFLEYLGRNIADRNIFICGTCRREELKENMVLKKMINNLKDEGDLNQIELSPFKFKNLYSFLDSTITPGSNSSELVRYLIKRTGGNPFFVEEILRTLLHKRGVIIGSRIGIEDFKHISIPETIEDIVLKRIKDLDSNSQKVVAFAAVLLKDFKYDLMQRLTNLDDTQLSKALWELKRKQIIIEEDNKYRFYHATLREAINKRMAYREKRKLYYQSGKTLELIYKRNIEGMVEDLAYYFINARDRKKSIKYGLRAAKKSSERYANEQAIAFYKGVLGLLDAKDLKCRFNVLQELARIDVSVGFYDDAIENYDKVLHMKIGTSDVKIDICSKIGYVYEIKGEYNKALHIYKHASRFLNRIIPIRLRKLLETYINVKICKVYQNFGDYKNAAKFSFDNLQFLKDSKEKTLIRLQSRIYNTLGLIEFNKVHYGREKFDRAIYYYKKAYKCYNKLKDKDRTAAILTNLGLSYYWKRELPKAFDCFQKSLQISEKTGRHYGILINLSNLGLVFMSEANYLKALSYFKKTLSMSKKIGNRLVVTESLGGMSVCFFYLCNYKKTKECLEKIIKICNTQDLKSHKISALMNIGSVHQALGDYNSALRLYTKVWKISKNYRKKLLTISSLVNISSLFIDLGQFSKTKRYLGEVLKTAFALESNSHAIRCYLLLSRLNLMLRNNLNALSYYEKGIRIAKKLRIKPEILNFFLLVSQIYYHEEKYSKGLKNADRAIKLSKEMGTKDLHAEALLMKAKNGIKQGVLSRIEVRRILDEAMRIAEEIGCPEILWKIYFEYGKLLQDSKQYLNAFEYYQKCIKIFRNVVDKIKNESYRMSYLHRPDRQAVFTKIDEIENL